MSPIWRNPNGTRAFSRACCGGRPQPLAQEDPEVKNLKKAAAVTMLAGGLIAAGAGVASATHGGAQADGVAKNSPGVGSGNLVQIPVHIPVNACGNTLTVIGGLNPAFGNTCVNV
ncbi:hypothetical protein SALBM135S_07784 [Streptomyces alboniger]